MQRDEKVRNYFPVDFQDQFASLPLYRHCNRSHMPGMILIPDRKENTVCPTEDCMAFGMSYIKWRCGFLVTSRPVFFYPGSYICYRGIKIDPTTDVV